MTYVFKCSICNKEVELDCLASEYHDIAKPTCCGEQMNRQFLSVKSRSVGVGGNKHQGIH
jgi:hypothetical protein